MSFLNLNASGCIRTVAGVVGLGLVFATPAAAGGIPAPPVVKNAAMNPLGCVVSNALSNPFSPWNDSADYALAPGGNFETTAGGWTLSRGAAITSGNQPFAVGAGGGSSLRLPANSSATSAPMCIDSRYPHFRVFARNAGNLKSELKAEVLFLDAKGEIKSTESGTVRAASSAWTPTDSLKIGVTFNPAVAAGAAPVAFRFTSAKDADWQLDDLYVDPRMNR